MRNKKLNHYVYLFSELGLLTKEQHDQYIQNIKKTWLTAKPLMAEALVTLILSSFREVKLSESIKKKG